MDSSSISPDIERKYYKFSIISHHENDLIVPHFDDAMRLFIMSELIQCRKSHVTGVACFGYLMPTEKESQP